MRFVSFALMAMTLAFGAAGARAQEWPTRNVKIILPSGPGSGADVGIRFMIEKLQAQWGKAVVIEPRPGGNSLVSINAFVSANDDHTLFFGPSSFFITHPHRYAKLSYDRARDMIPIVQVSGATLGFAVKADTPAKDLKEFVAWARANPGKISFAVAPGATEMVLDAFMKEQGIDAAKVPYRDVVQAANDLAEGRLQAVLASLTIFQAGLQDNRLRILSISGAKPSEFAPGVKTALEQGYQRLAMEGLLGLFAPRAMNEAARKKLEADFLKVAADPEIARRLVTIGQVHNVAGAADFDAAIRAHAAAIAEVAKILDIKPE